MANTTGQKYGGRAKGTENKVTKDIRAMFKDLVENNLATLQDDIDKLTGVDRVKYTLEMSKFCIPTLKSVDYKGDVVVSRPKKIQFVDKSKPEILVKKQTPEEVNFLPETNKPPF